MAHSFMVNDLEALYKHYSKDLLEDRQLLYNFYSNTGGMMNDIEAEVMYMLIRHSMPRCLIEIGCCNGWSTAWILSATRRNKLGYTVSYDRHEGAVKPINKFFPEQVAKGGGIPSWSHVAGDATTKHFMDGIDFLLIDADHCYDFAKWYIREVFPKVKVEAWVCVHDIFPHAYFGEDDALLDWLDKKSIPYFTCAPSKEPEACDRIMKLREELGFGRVSKEFTPSFIGDIHAKMIANSMLYFQMPLLKE